MAYPGFQTSHKLTKGGTIASLIESAAAAAGAIERRRRIARRRKALESLTVDALKDIGYPGGPETKPVLEVKAGLMTTLMSMR